MIGPIADPSRRLAGPRRTGAARVERPRDARGAGDEGREARAATARDRRRVAAGAERDASVAQACAASAVALQSASRLAQRGLHADPETQRRWRRAYAEAAGPARLPAPPAEDLTA